MSQVVSAFGSILTRTRRRWWWAALAVVYLLPFLAFSGFGAFDVYLKIEGIPGESADEKHKDWIEVSSFSFAMSRAIAPPGQVSQPKLDDVAVRKSIDKSSPVLMLHCCQGKHIPEATLEYSKDTAKGDAVYLKIKMSDCLITGYSFSGGGGGSASLPVESLSLNFTKIEMSYIPYDATGNPLSPVTAECSFSQSTP